MAIRTNTNPMRPDLQPEMRALLMRNGMQAHIVPVGDSYQLVVQGHDSPLLRYPISRQQMQALTDWGTNHANKKAYETFTDIVKDDFDMPRNFVHARNANGRVAMGLHGYRIGIGEYGRVGRYGMPPPFLGWTPRQQEGYHLRRVGGRLFYAGTPMVAERPDERMKPGEMQSGGYGFYYKGHRQPQEQVQPVRQDVLQDLQAVITPMVNKPRSEEPAKPYKELITSPVYFSNEKWQECLASHGIIIDEKVKTLTIQSSSTQADMIYYLRADELKALTNNSIKEAPIAKRLEILNSVIKDDFADKITMDMLNSKEVVAINLKPEVKQELEAQLAPQLVEEQNQAMTVEQEVDNPKVGRVHGQDLDESKGWFREGRHGREVMVEDIQVAPSEQEGKYKMTAIINGESISHEITQKQYDKFMAVDDYHRMKLFSKVFNEVDMKSRGDGVGLGTKIGAALLAGLRMAGDVTYGAADIVHNIEHIKEPHAGPEIYVEQHCAHPRPYFKPGVDTPMDVAARNFEAAMNMDGPDHHMSNGR